MSEEYGDLKLVVPDDEDEADGADVPLSFRKYTDGLDARLAGSKGQLPVVQSTGSPAAKTVKGDATLADDGTLTLTRQAQTARATSAVIAGGGLGSVEVPWPTAFADTSYTVQVTVQELLEGDTPVVSWTVATVEKSKIVVTVKNNSGIAFKVVVHAAAVHD